MDLNVTDLSNLPSEQTLEESLTPVQREVLNQTNPQVPCILSNGRKISFKKPSGIVSFTIGKLLGSESMNPALTLFYRVAFCIASLDDKPVISPKTALEVEAIVARLGDDFDEVVNVWSQCAINTPEESPAKK